MFSCSSPPRWRRAVTLLAGCGAAVALALAGQPAHADPVTNDPAEAAAGWLARQLVDGERFEVEFDGEIFLDQALTLDAVLAFSATGVAGEHADAAMAWLATPEVLDNYLNVFGGERAGSYAKLSFTAQVQGLDPASFGGVDLLAELVTFQRDDGRFVDRPLPGEEDGFADFSNAFVQAFAILTLDRTPGGTPATAVAYLVGQQCPDGGFPQAFEQETCVSSVDHTAMAAQALLAVGEDQAAMDAIDWVAGQPLGNANSAGLAAQALRAGGRDTAADEAVLFLRSLQVGCDGPADQHGAVALDENGFDESTASRATAQAILGLAGVGFDELDGTGLVADVPVLDCATPEPTVPPEEGEGGEKLPVTGSPVAVLVGTGVLLAGVGSVAIWVTRRRGTGTIHA